MKGKSFNNKAVLEIILSIIVIYLVLVNTMYLPSLAVVFMCIFTIPITAIYILRGYKDTLLILVTGAFLVSLSYMKLIPLFYAFSYGIVGVSLGHCIKKKKKNSVSIIITAIFIAISNIIQFIVYSIFVYKKTISSSINDIVDGIKKSFTITKDTYVALNAPSEFIDGLNEIIKLITIQKLVVILPMIILANSLIQAYINYYFTSKVLQKLDCEIDDITKFTRIYIPNLLVAFLIIAFCMGIIINSKGISVGNYISEITGYILKFLITLNGITFFAYILRNKLKLSRVVSIIILLVGLIMPIFADIYIVSGIMDIILNLRELDPNPIRKVKKRE
ncbi:DUF2232 domain-containing protein [Clostridium sp. MB40-C1]|uniref:DUF2232 domain-containing protein n=1 Tax=Clostridium sp. MB40-C1 TaxID=3070996 RepID=UPI0027E09442|nr:DUF2232 domain-containing protein [Clostridium sp. MB40-C1]WMJ80092.1 DUF2232 domain-containing protein [Clostridium sp. MB40-C1]